MKLLRDTWLIYTRMLLLTVRNPLRAYIGLFQPICFLFLFSPLLNNIGLTAGLPSGSSLLTFTPGLLAITAMNCGFVGFGLMVDIKAGVIERFRVTPINRLALLLGRSLRDITVLLAQLILLLVITYIWGLRADLAGVLISCILVLLLGLVMSSFSYIIALALKEIDVLAPTLNFFLLPAQLLSGFMLPLTLAPSWIQYAALINPFAYAVTASRALFMGNLTDSSVLIAFAVITALAVLALYFCARALRSITS